MLEGLVQDFQLTLPYFLRRAEQLYGHREIVTRLPDKSFHRHTYADFVARSKKLAVALGNLGLEPGDRVGTLGWNTYQHLEAYFGVPTAGLVLHTLNPRLHEDDLAYIAGHADDRVMLVDETLVPVYEKFGERTNVEHVVVVTDDGASQGGPLLAPLDGTPLHDGVDGQHVRVLRGRLRAARGPHVPRQRLGTTLRLRPRRGQANDAWPASRPRKPPGGPGAGRGYAHSRGTNDLPRGLAGPGRGA